MFAFNSSFVFFQSLLSYGCYKFNFFPYWILKLSLYVPFRRLCFRDDIRVFLWVSLLSSLWLYWNGRMYSLDTTHKFCIIYDSSVLALFFGFLSFFFSVASWVAFIFVLLWSLAGNVIEYLNNRIPLFPYNWQLLCCRAIGTGGLECSSQV